jgi:hypothetical protein
LGFSGLTAAQYSKKRLSSLLDSLNARKFGELGFDRPKLALHFPTDQKAVKIPQRKVKITIPDQNPII